ncbi:MAG: 3-oxoacyl-[acyl-carrier-protein] synthase III C-terminal domain-containing protein [Pseudobdellovibrio sp.]
MSSVFLNQFHVVKPKNCIAQDELLNWIIKCHQLAEERKQSSDSVDKAIIEKLFHRYGVKSAQIHQRYLECDDVLSCNFENNEVYQISDSHKSGADISVRANFYSDRAYEVFKKFYDITKIAVRPDHLIHVSCTGYVSPSAAQKIVTEQMWNQITDITHAYHMGCYAAMPAVRLAKSLVIAESIQNTNFTTDIIHTEMCGLHMNPLAQTPEQMVVQTLFADGHVKYTATSETNESGQSLKIIAMLEKVLPNSQQDMSWVPAPWGMQMNLSREVPEKIKLELKKFSNELFIKANLSIEVAMKSIFAIHPGGPKIIDSVQEVLELSNDQVVESKKVLFERGNMSSATLPHVWSEILNNNYPVGTKVISYAFGPGLTLFGSVFEVC